MTAAGGKHTGATPAGEPLPLLSLPSVFFYANAFLAFSTSSTRITRKPASSPLALP